MTSSSEAVRLSDLARLHGIQTSYFNVRGHRSVIPAETLRRMLLALGTHTETAQQRREAWQQAQDRARERPIDHVIVAWDGHLRTLDIRQAEDGGPAMPELEIAGEDGFSVVVDTRCCRIERLQQRRPEAHRETILRLHLDITLPCGYHELHCTEGSRRTTALLLAAPTRCYTGEEERAWGLFAPLYALRGHNDGGAGSYRELEELVDYAAEKGGRLVGTLPLLPCFLDSGGEPSPYIPITRLLWSEFYVDVAAIPHYGGPLPPEVLQAAAMQQQRLGSQHNPQVDYAAVSQLRRAALEAAYHHGASATALRDHLMRFSQSCPHARDYAAFRATMDRFGAPWTAWPEPAAAGKLTAGCYDEDNARLRLFEQWVAHEQMTRCVRVAEARGAGLYLDLPVGVHPEGYDTWRFRNAFVLSASTGAPPDIVFTTGQRWGSPPLHPHGIRERRYDYVREYLRHHMSSARMLRVDHVMGLHRIYCIPEGAEPSAGAYLRYRPEEWYALLSLESHRNKTILVGEDLGLVPREVHRAMDRHGLSRMFVLYYEMDNLAAGRAPGPSRNSLASLNTHDMPPFASMWQCVDIRQHQQVGILAPSDAPEVRRKRRDALRHFVRVLREVCPALTGASPLDIVLRCTLSWLGKSPARFVMVNVEDLWCETAQQNMPGVGDAYPSWRQRAARTLQQLRRDTVANETLSALNGAMARCREPEGENNAS